MFNDYSETFRMIWIQTVLINIKYKIFLHKTIVAALIDRLQFAAKLVAILLRPHPTVKEQQDGVGSPFYRKTYSNKLWEFSFLSGIAVGVSNSRIVINHSVRVGWSAHFCERLQNVTSRSISYIMRMALLGDIPSIYYR